MATAHTADLVGVLVDELDATGTPLTDAVRAAMLAVPREQFIPECMWFADDDGEYHPVDRSEHPDRWAAAVYSDRVLVTQFDDGATTWPRVGRRPTCTASQPSVVAGMLADLGPRPGEHVGEIGTGTGYNTALLAHLVGEHGTVTTVEVDHDLHWSARRNVVEAGFHNVAFDHADGTARFPAGPVDRMLSTASVLVGRLPYLWVRQTRPGGVIVAPIRADLASGPVVRLEVHEDGTATGRASDQLQAGFMEVRSQRVAGFMAGVRWDDPDADVTFTGTAPWPVLLEPDPRWALAVALPSVVYDVWERTEERRGVAWLMDPRSRSWATVSPLDDDGLFAVRQIGPRRLWTEAEHALRWWRARGAPAVHEWVWTVGPREQGVTLP
jgi:protein-L-isoaspartate O-methyltransferase